MPLCLIIPPYWVYDCHPELVYWQSIVLLLCYCLILHYINVILHLFILVYMALSIIESGKHAISRYWWAAENLCWEDISEYNTCAGIGVIAVVACAPKYLIAVRRPGRGWLTDKKVSLRTMLCSQKLRRIMSLGLIYLSMYVSTTMKFATFACSRWYAMVNEPYLRQSTSLRTHRLNSWTI